MDDLISRQAVIDYICHYDCGCPHDKCEGEDCDYVDGIMTLPSVSQAVVNDSQGLVNDNDLISRQAVLDIVNNPLNIRLADIIKALPSVTPKEKTGKWIYDEQSKVYRCSCCNRFPWRVQCENHDEIFIDLTRTNAYKYCPNCGKKMVEPQESEEV